MSVVLASVVIQVVKEVQEGKSSNNNGVGDGT